MSAEMIKKVENLLKSYREREWKIAVLQHISKVLREHYPNSQIISTDLVQRDDRFGCGIVGGVDFLTENYPEKFNNVITNPPFSLAKEFAEKALEVSTGKVILFAKIQFLEGRQRKDLYEDAYDDIGADAVAEMQRYLNEWKEKYGRTSYLLTTKHAIRIPWEEMK